MPSRDSDTESVASRAGVAHRAVLILTEIVDNVDCALLKVRELRGGIIASLAREIGFTVRREREAYRGEGCRQKGADLSLDGGIPTSRESNEIFKCCPASVFRLDESGDQNQKSLQRTKQSSAAEERRRDEPRRPPLATGLPARARPDPRPPSSRICWDVRHVQLCTSQLTVSLTCERKGEILSGRVQAVTVWKALLLAETRPFTAALDDVGSGDFESMGGRSGRPRPALMRPLEMSKSIA